jgi:hypothetical protein
MSGFLNREQVKYFEDLQKIPNMTVLNGNGNKKQVKAFLLGANKCKLSKVLYREGKKCSFIQLIFEREKVTTVDDKRLTFGPLKEIFFNNQLDMIDELANCFDHSFPTIVPDGYTIEAYLKAICLRLHTFISRELIVNITYQKRIVRDDYGDVKYHINQDYKEYVKTPIIVTQPSIFSFGNKKFDWMNCKMGLNERDRNDNKIITVQKEQKD